MMSSIRDSKRRAAAPREGRQPDPGGARPARSTSKTDGQDGGGEQLLTTANKILVAAHVLDEERESFTAEDLIVRSWQLYPESFGLAGYREHYPDSNRVLSKLMGSVGLCSRGWLEQVSTKTYRMTVAGRKLAQSLRTGQPAAEAVESVPPPATRPARVAPREVRAVEPGERKSEVPRIVPREQRDSQVEAKPAARVEKPVENTERISRPSPERISRPSPERVERSERAEAKSAPPPAPVAKPAPVVAAPPPPKPVEAPVSRPPEPPRAVASPVKAPDGVPAKFDATVALQRLVASAAGQKFTRGGLVTWADACQFWSITPAMHPVHLNARLAEIEALLKKAENTISSSGAPIKIHDRLEISLTTVIGLQGLHRMLIQKYHREIDAIRARGEE